LHLWVVGTLGLAWSAIGAFDYVMTETRNATYMSAFTPEQLAFFYGFPAWVVAAWAIAVWVFFASLAGPLLTTFHNYVLSNGMEIFGDGGSQALTVLIFLVSLALFLYARAMRRRRVLV
jgi:hypothetical protein